MELEWKKTRFISEYENSLQSNTKKSKKIEEILNIKGIFSSESEKYLRGIIHLIKNFN